MMVYRATATIITRNAILAALYRQSNLLNIHCRNKRDAIGAPVKIIYYLTLRRMSNHPMKRFAFATSPLAVVCKINDAGLPLSTKQRDGVGKENVRSQNGSFGRGEVQETKNHIITSFRCVTSVNKYLSVNLITRVSPSHSHKGAMLP